MSTSSFSDYIFTAVWSYPDLMHFTSRYVNSISNAKSFLFDFTLVKRGVVFGKSNGETSSSDQMGSNSAVRMRRIVGVAMKSLEFFSILSAFSPMDKLATICQGLIIPGVSPCENVRKAPLPDQFLAFSTSTDIIFLLRHIPLLEPRCTLVSADSEWNEDGNSSSY